MTGPADKAEAREQRIVAERRSLPDAPGVYLFRDRDDEVIYVGKAISIRKRVASHFSGGNAEMTRLIERIEFLVTESESEALIAEQSFIKRYRPRFNIKLRDDKAAGKEPMTFAMVFPVSTHNYEIRYWMGSAGIDPDQDVRLIVIPPPQMVANLKAGNIVGYCVGEPWNERAVEAGIGRTLITNYEIWNNNPEKVFGVNLEWHEKNPRTHQALIMALLEATQWMDQPKNRMEVVGLIAQKSYVNAPDEVVKMSSKETLLAMKRQECKSAVSSSAGGGRS